MIKRYKITIKEEGEEVRTIGKTWSLGAGDTPEDFGYTPETTATRQYERTIYEQTVEEIDMGKVVGVINGLNA